MSYSHYTAVQTFTDADMATERKLYWGSGSTPAWRVLIALKEKGLEFDSKLIEFSKGERFVLESV